MANFVRNFALTVANTPLGIPAAQLKSVKNHKFAVNGGNVTITYNIGSQSFTVNAVAGQHVLEMSDIDGMTFASASTSNLTYLGD